MVSFSSSVINKSGKKFAPKAPVRRAAPAPPPATPRRSSVAQQTSAPQTTQSVTTTTHNASPDPPAPVVEDPSIAAPTTTDATQTTEPVSQKTTAIPNPSSSTIPIPLPQPKRKPSLSAPSSQSITPIPIPTPPQPTPQSRNTPTTEPTSIAPITPKITESEIRAEDVRDGEPPRISERSDETRIASASPQPRRLSETETTADIRPAKRLKTSQPTVASGRAQSIFPQSITPPTTQPVATEDNEATETPDETVPQASTEKGKKVTKARKPRAATSGTTGNATETQRLRRSRARKKREPTPEDAELVEIAPAIVKMSDLCKDLRTGKMSKREMELRNMEQAEHERKQRALEEGESADQTPIKQNGDAASPLAEQDRLAEKKSQAGPVMRIVNGEIVLDTASLQVDRHADAARNVGELEDVVETSLTRKINQATYGKRSKTESWDEEMTDLFYRGLRMFGTDFMMISKMFPGRSRRQIKLKFNNEERKDPQRIKDTLWGPRESIDIATYSEMTNTVYDDPKVIQQELDEEKKRIEDQHAKEKEAQEELLRNPSGADEGTDGASAEKGNNVNVKGKSRNNKKQAMKSVGGGTEEVVGSIDDFPFSV